MSETGSGPARGPVPAEPLGLWEGYGVEIEFMIVDADSLDVRCVADRLFQSAVEIGGDEVDEESADVPGIAEHEVEGVAWSNELALHVLELKTPGPAETLKGLADGFRRSLTRARDLLKPMGCTLLPGGVHPWMDPEREFRIWPHEYTEVYRTFDRIFSCRGHGWANLQSTHLNLPFRDDEEFRVLHEAVRTVLPLIPALSAASPILDGRVTGVLDARLLAYRENARRVPQVTGKVVPEKLSSRVEYQAVVLDPIYRAMRDLDPEGVLRHEWVNARGAIARFDRGSIEVRVVDAQEGPTADLAVVAAVTAAARRVTDVLDSDPALHGRYDTPRLADLLDATTRTGRRARPSRVDYRTLLALDHPVGDAGEIWAAFLESSELLAPESEWSDALRTMLDRGTLAERILEALGFSVRDRGEEPDRDRLRETYRRLEEEMERGTVFLP